MRYVIVVLFFVFQSSCSQKRVQTGTNQNINRSCQDIKCPPVDEPVCARVTNVNNKNSNPVHILMVNICEMEYMKCHQGLQASIVDMKNCGHQDYQTLNKLIKDKGRKRSKREIDSGIVRIDPTPIEKKNIARSDKTQDTSGDIITLDNNDEDMTNPLPEEMPNEFLDTSYSGDTDPVEPDASPEITSANNVPDAAESEDVPEPKKKLPEIVILEETDNDLEPNQVSPEIEDLPESDDLPEDDLSLPETKQEQEPGIVILESSAAEPESVSKENSGRLSDGLENNIKFTDKSIFKDNNNNALPNDYDEYQADCPTFCPSRDVMVCAKCQHDIYKTFMSVCHMRMFSCWFTDEKLELVSRYPCAMSAPFLSTKPNTDPKGKISLADDEDRILKFIYCREKGDPSYIEGKNKLLFSENSNVYPRCDFDKITKLQFLKE